MQKLSVEEYAKLINVSPKTVYRRIERGQVITCKDTVNNKEVTRIIADDKEILNSDMSQSCQKHVSQDVMSECQNDDIIDSSYVNVSQNHQYLDFIKKMYEDNKNLAELAGQAKLLTDSEGRTRQEYFQLIQENKQAERERAELLAKTQLLEKQNQEYSQVIQENKIMSQEQAELKAKIELLQEKNKELEENFNQQKELIQKPEKKTIKQIIRDWINN